MKSRLLSIAALALLLASPLAAQQLDPYEPEPQEEQQPIEEQQPMDDPELEAEAEGDTEVDSDADAVLPQTASPLGLLALIGLGGAGAALGLRKARRK
jgi:hypothetical protein